MNSLEAHKKSDGEIRALEFVEDSPQSLEAFLRQHHGKISATGEAALLFHGLHSHGQNWFESASSFMH